MAVTLTKLQSNMILNLKVGLDANGQDVIKGQRFSKVKVSASDDDIYAVAEAIGSLLKYPVADVVREDQNQLING